LTQSKLYKPVAKVVTPPESVKSPAETGMTMVGTSVGVKVWVCVLVKV
jgi:hypothetical protein